MGEVRAALGRRLAGLGLAACTAVAVTVGLVGPASAAEGDVRGLGTPGAVKDSFIVVLKNTVSAQEVRGKAAGLAQRYGGEVKQTYGSALSGFAAKISEEQVRKLAADPSVAYVEQDQVIRKSDTQANPPSWGLDRIDQRDLPLSGSYNYSATAGNVHAYIIDTGIRVTHPDFGGRASAGFDAVTAGGTADDCDGHGTHVAGTVGGTAHGVAKGVRLKSVRVLDCNGSGTVSGVVAGVDWVTANAVKPAVANMSLSGNASGTLDAAVQRSIAAGITYGLAAGNGDFSGNPVDACAQSPARTPEAITVSATDRTDTKAHWANIGTCVDLFAPGVDITSAYYDDPSTPLTISGTSMATPHVVGAAALYLGANPGATPQQVRDALVNTATSDKVVNPGAGSPNKLLHVAPPAECKPRTNSTRLDIPDGGAAVTSQITLSTCSGNGKAGSRVGVDIKHPYRGDLSIDLIAPSGAVKNLKTIDGRDGADDVHEIYTVDLSAETANGVWKLRVRDHYTGDVGYVNTWTMAI